MLPSLSLPPLEFCFGTSPIQAEKSRPDRNALGSPMLATSAVASAGPTPGMASSRLLVSFDRCHARMRRSKARIWAFSASNCVPRAATQARASSGGRVSLASATTLSNCSTPRRPTVELGGLMAYAHDAPEQWRHGAQQIDRILKGAKPQDIPFYQVTKYELILNLKTAKALGLTFPPSLAPDEVIE